MFTRNKITIAILSACLVPSYAFATDLAPVEVTATAENAQEVSTDTSELLQSGNSETGTTLRQISGVDASRMGGHGVDLVIRGQQASQLNVLIDGAKIEGGCPNRMDPPTAYAEMSSFDEVTVVKGVNSVTYGSGGTGGTVLFERNAPTFEEGKPYNGEINIGGTNNGVTQDINATVSAGGDKGYIVLQGAKKSADNYTDGNGDEVRSSYDSKQGHVEVGYRPTENQLLKLSFEQSVIEDALFEGASMDSPESDGRTLRLGYEAKNIAKNIKNLEFDIYRSEVDHIMDNYTFRSTTPSANRMESPTNVETRGAKLKLTSKMGETTLDYGIQFESLDKDAIVYNVTNYLANPMAYTDSWPDALQETRSVFAESTTPLTNEQKLIAGLRYDSVTHEIDRTNKAVTIYTNTYADYSGTTKKDDSNLNGLLRLESKLGGLDSYVALSRTHRYPDATELFVAMGGKWIGNPDLKPEQHNQLDFGLAQNQGATTWSVNAYYDSVSDYVLRDLAINQDASLLNNGASIYVNKDAVIYGLNGAIKKQLNQDISLGMNASLTQGENTTDNRTLSNIAPLSGSAYGEYSKSNWLAGARFNFATEQTDTNELFNELETPAWSSVDLYGEYQINKTFALNAGVDNLFDHAYYTYFNRTDATTGADYKVYEPGRIVWAKLNAKF